MKKILLLITIVCFSLLRLQAQGPPIMTDKPIMMGAGRSAFMTQVQFRDNRFADFTYIPVMYFYDFSDQVELKLAPSIVLQEELEGGLGLGDAMAELKYQFYRKDKIGSTLRVATRLRQTFPTGRDFHTFDLGLGAWQTNFAVLGGIESLRYGIQGEIGYTFFYADQDIEEFGHELDNMIEYKLGFGLPLLKPTYPVKQINLFFEYEGMYMPATGEYGLYYSQGAQYAVKNWTFDLAVQAPLSQQMHLTMERNSIILLGFRFIM